MCGPKERLSRRRSPVNQQLVAIAVGEPYATDVDGITTVVAHHMSKAKVDSVAAKHPQPLGKAVYLQVAIQRGLTCAPRASSFHIEALGQVRDLVFEPTAKYLKVTLVACRQRSIGFAG
jgi:hypothetical protein